MSTDHFYSVKDGKATELRREEMDWGALASADGVFCVRLNHGVVKVGTEESMLMIDDVYLFNSRQEAQAFIDGGYKKALYVGEDEPDYISHIYIASSYFAPSSYIPF